MKDRIPVYAVLRVDKYREESPGPVEDLITVQSVLPTIEEARREVDRLNSIRDTDRILYFLRVTRFYPDGRKGPTSSPSVGA